MIKYMAIALPARAADKVSAVAAWQITSVWFMQAIDVSPDAAEMDQPRRRSGDL
jgi:hypothetical protein